MSIGSLENWPPVLEACDVFLLDAAAVLNVFAKAKKATCLKHTIMNVLISFQVKCLLMGKGY